jgi:amidohydrolase
MYQKAKALENQLIAWRRDFHRFPELGFQEKRTAARVAEIMTGLGYKVRTGVGRTGVIADLGEGKPRVGIRADMDALPILEANLEPYASENAGVMHACGHDSHVAMALGAATLLAKEKLPGSVRFLFQPSEEASDKEGFSGARRMIQDGALEGVDCALALHVDPVTPVGEIGTTVGPASGGVDSWFATIKGRGGHAARPQETTDTLQIAAHVILAVQAIASRKIDPGAPAVVAVGSIHGGQAENVIPDTVEMNGTIRFMDPAIQAIIHTELRNAFEIAKAFGGDYDLRIEIGDPPMINDERIVQLTRESVAELFGAEKAQQALFGLGAEDFSRFQEVIPGAMFALGCLIDADPRMIHNARFDIDERCLPIGTALLAETALRMMKVDWPKKS